MDAAGATAGDSSAFLVLRPLQPLSPALHAEIDLAGGAGDVGPRGGVPAQHLAGIRHLLAVDAGCEPLREGVRPEVAPEIPAAAQHLAVEVHLGPVPELVADRLGVVAPEALLELGAGG